MNAAKSAGRYEPPGGFAGSWFGSRTMEWEMRLAAAVGQGKKGECVHMGNAQIWQAKGWFLQQYRNGAESRHW